MKKVLVLDDEKELLDLWITHFRMWKLEAEIVTGLNGLEGLELLKQHGPFDLIITDFIMPAMDGYDFVKEVRKDDQKTPVCFFTGHLPELAFLADEMEKVFLFEKPAISPKMRSYITICLNDELTPIEAI